ncbi:MAG: methyltransferase domain-containing protein [Clostridia bacterium]|nr:methyltransferase domain-containing protein [Clostridia bacterium]
MYDDFAGVYDTLMDDYDYDAWSAYYLSLIDDMLEKRPARAAECACGTGSLTVRFAKEGLAMTGVDLSASMLRRAEEKARKWGVKSAFVRQDMKKLELPRRVGAILATCDGVNYLTTPDDVRAFFAAAYRQLLPGGVLCFDCSSRHKLEVVMGDAFFGEERDGLSVLWQNALNRESHVLTMDVTFFVREEDGRYRRFREQHHQRAHDVKEIIAWLTEAGFEDIHAYGEMRKDAPKEDDIRIHYAARKPQEEEFEL